VVVVVALLVLLLLLLLQGADLREESGRCELEVLLVCASCWTCGWASELCGTSSVSATLKNRTGNRILVLVVDSAYKLIVHVECLAHSYGIPPNTVLAAVSAHAVWIALVVAVLLLLLPLHVCIALALNNLLACVNCTYTQTTAYDVALAFVSIGTAVLSLLLLSLLIIENGKLNARVYLMCVAVRSAASFGQCIFAGTLL
jgi:hypothetical protein